MRAGSRAAATLLVAVACVASPCRGATNRVPADFSTIHEALEASALGDTVLVAPGTYSGYVLYGGNEAYVGRVPDGVVLMSEAGPSQTIIDLAPLEGVTYWSAAFGMSGNTSGQTVIDGFRVVGLSTHSVGVSVGFSEQIEVRNCSFEVPEGATVQEAQGIGGLYADLRAVNCTFLRCQTALGGSGIQITIGDVTVENCSFIDCGTSTALGSGAGAASDPPGFLEVRNCLFQRCVTTTGGGGIASGQRGGILIDNCVFEEMDAIGRAGAALELGSLGSHSVVSNNVFRDFNISTGAGCIYIPYGTAVLSGNTFANLHQPQIPAGVALTTAAVGDLVLENNVFAHLSGAEALIFNEGVALTLDCNVFWDNADGIGIDLSPTDRIVDPQFCDPENGNYTLQSTSPCLPDLSLGCGLIGALGQGCGTVSLAPETWGKIKASFRDEKEAGQ
ncbi:right-handed parallel beta-helix repeat-containing protein [bacterium]|nr:right-handed parallel beta-helix repeat-containing protein [bacterium]